MIVDIAELVGGGYGEFWKCKKRYRVVKGSRASKKSKTMALWLIFNLMKYPQANALVVRKVFGTLKNSCYSDLKWATDKLKVSNLWKFKSQPLEATFLPTGQKILFRGFDDPLKITSISVPHGALCWVWIEEAYELMDESAFNMLDESIRGIVPNGLFKQITITMNPWNERHWIKSRFFDNKDNENIFTATTTYECNEWLDGNDYKLFIDMKKQP